MKSKKNVAKDIDQILIAEDSPTQAEQLKYLLEKHKYKVIVAKDGKEAIGMVIEHSPSLVITDIVMPEMNGYDLCKEIKSREKTMGIPVILLTSFSRSEDVMEGISCGADNFLTKPFREEYLVSHIEQILSNREIYKSETIKVELEVLVGGKKRVITVDHQQILTLLISTYEAAVQRNDELVQAQDDLKKLNERLEDLVTERTAELSAEIAIRKRTEKALRESKEQQHGNLSKPS
jgi:DNA-binding response OmpR family regulator